MGWELLEFEVVLQSFLWVGKLFCDFKAAIAAILSHCVKLILAKHGCLGTSIIFIIRQSEVYEAPYWYLFGLILSEAQNLHFERLPPLR